MVYLRRMKSTNMYCMEIIVMFVFRITVTNSLSCDAGKYPVYVPKGKFTLDLSGLSGYPAPKFRQSVDSEIKCQIQCDDLNEYECRSFSFSPVSKQCILYPVGDTVSGVTKSYQGDVQLYEGICSDTPNLDNCEETNAKVDLAFAIDASGSICAKDPSNDDNDVNRCNNWRLLKNFIKQIINLLTIGPSNTRVALITFADEGKVQFNLTSHTSKSAIDRFMDGIEFIGGSTNIYDALLKMRTQIFNGNDGDRSDVTNLAFIITDGYPNVEADKTDDEALALRNNGVIMFSVGITARTQEAWLKNMSSSPHELNRNYFKSPDFDQVLPVINNLLSAACIKLNPAMKPSEPSPVPTSEPEGASEPTPVPTSEPEGASEPTPVPTSEPEGASEPTPVPTSEQEGEAELSPEDVYEWMKNHKEYVAMIGMGIVIILLFITVIVILCCYTGGSSGRSDKYVISGRSSF